MGYISLQVPKDFRFTEEIVKLTDDNTEIHEYDIAFPTRKTCQISNTNSSIGETKICKNCYYRELGDKMVSVRKSKRKDFLKYQLSLRNDGLLWLEELNELLIDTEDQFDKVDLSIANDYQYIIEDIKTESIEEKEDEDESEFDSIGSNLQELIAEKIANSSIDSPPSDIADCVTRYRKDYPEGSKTAFLIMQFTNTEVHDKIVSSIKSILKEYDITALRADDKQYSDDLFQNIKTYMHCCDFAIAIFERIIEDDFNPNVSLEVGYLMGLNKPVCLLKDKSLKNLPTDLAGKLYKPINLFKIKESIKDNLTKWLIDKEIITKY